MTAKGSLGPMQPTAEQIAGASAPQSTPPKGRESVFRYDMELEAILAAAALVSKRARAQIAASLTGDHIQTPEYRTIFRAALKAGEADPTAEAIDPVTIRRAALDHRYGEVDIAWVGEIMSNRPDAPAEQTLALHIAACAEDGRKAAAIAHVTKFFDEQAARKPAAELRVHLVEAARSLEPRITEDGLTYAEQVVAVPPAPSFLLPHFEFAAGRVGVGHGYGGSGKTLVVQELEIAIAAGLPDAWGGLALGGSGSVVHVSWEMPPDLTKLRLWRLARGRDLEYRELGRRHAFVCFPPWYLSDADAEARVMKVMEGRALATFDSLRAACPKAKENDGELRPYLDMLTRCSVRTGCVALVIAHDGKPGDKARAGGFALRGHSSTYDALGSAVQVSPSTRDKTIRLSQTKASIGAGGGPRVVRLVDDGTVLAEWDKPDRLRVVGVASRGEGAEVIARVNESAADNQRQTAARRTALDLLASGTRTQAELVDAIGGRRQAAIDVLRAVETDGQARSWLDGRTRIYEHVPTAPVGSEEQADDRPY